MGAEGVTRGKLRVQDQGPVQPHKAVVSLFIQALLPPETQTPNKTPFLKRRDPVCCGVGGGQAAARRGEQGPQGIPRPVPGTLFSLHVCSQVTDPTRGSAQTHRPPCSSRESGRALPWFRTAPVRRLHTPAVTRPLGSSYLGPHVDSLSLRQHTCPPPPPPAQGGGPEGM